jgi:hypothetical protein
MALRFNYSTSWSSERVELVAGNHTLALHRQSAVGWRLAVTATHGFTPDSFAVKTRDWVERHGFKHALFSSRAELVQAVETAHNAEPIPMLSQPTLRRVGRQHYRCGVFEITHDPYGSWWIEAPGHAAPGRWVPTLALAQAHAAVFGEAAPTEPLTAEVQTSITFSQPG